jgi:Flp pilus assembly protein TadD
MFARVAVSAVLVAALGGCAGSLLGGPNPPSPAPKTAAKSPTTPAASAANAQATQEQNQAAMAAAIAAASATLETELTRAQTLRVQGNYAEATKTLGQLVLVAPDDPRVVGEYGKVLVQQGGRSEDAIAFLRRAVALKSNDATLYSALGVAYDQADDPKSAKSAYDKALALHPGDAVVLNNYAVSRMLAGDYDGAQKLLAQAQAAGGSNPKVASNLQLLAQMRASKATAPKSTQAPTSKAVQTTTAAAQTKTAAPAAPKNLLSGNTAQPTTVVMQQVPDDSHAGPMHKAATPVHKVAAAKAKPAKTALAKSDAPALRTAD